MPHEGASVALDVVVSPTVEAHVVSEPIHPPPTVVVKGEVVVIEIARSVVGVPGVGASGRPVPFVVLDDRGTVGVEGGI